MLVFASGPLNLLLVLAGSVMVCGSGWAAAPEGMVWVPGGEFRMGCDQPYAQANERPERAVAVSGFWLDATPVTNAQFAAFVEASGYRTTAELPVDWDELKKQLPPGTPRPAEAMLRPGSLVFTPPPPGQPVELRNLAEWWTWTSGACWRHPEGPGSTIDGRGDHPVVQVSWDDAAAYAKWAGKRLPSEAEWEYAAWGGRRGTRYDWGDALVVDGRHMANTFTGTFPTVNDQADGFAGTAPVRAFPPNGYGLYGMAGNVWQWTADVFRFRPDAPDVPLRRVIKGGSFLCHPTYCESYRPTARRGTPTDTGSSHVGFRCAWDGPKPPEAAP